MRFGYLIEPPFNDHDESGEVIGCDVDLARFVLGKLGETFEPVETEFHELLPGLADGRWRMTTGMFANDARRKIADFSRPIWALPDGLLVQSGNPKDLSGYASAGDDPSVRVAIVKKQVQHDAAIAFGVDAGRITVFESYTDAADAVQSGQVDCFASVARAHHGYCASTSAPLDVITVPTSERPPAFGHFAFRKGDPLGKAVDEILGKHLGSPAHHSTMQGYGFTDAELAL